MARRPKERIYRRRRPLRTLIKVLGAAVLTIAILLVVVFFWFQSYIVYTPEGIRLDIPFLRGILDEIPENAQEEPFPVLPPEAPGDPAEPVRPGETEPPPSIRSVLFTGEALATIPDWDLTLAGFRADAILVAMNDETGLLWWESAVEMARSYALSGEGNPGPILEAMDPEVWRSALLVGFQNELMASRNPPLALAAEGWLDPRDVEVRDYVMDLALELGRLGFDEIVLADFTFPPDYPETADAVIISFLRDLASALGTLDVRLSVMTHELDWYDPEDTAHFFRPGLFQLAEIVFRFYCVIEPTTLADEERYAALMAAVQSILGGGAYRFVPVGPGGGPEEGNWVVQADIGN